MEMFHCAVTSKNGIYSCQSLVLLSDEIDLQEAGIKMDWKPTLPNQGDLLLITFLAPQKLEENLHK